MRQEIRIYIHGEIDCSEEMDAREITELVKRGIQTTGELSELAHFEILGIRVKEERSIYGNDDDESGTFEEGDVRE